MLYDLCELAIDIVESHFEFDNEPVDFIEYQDHFDVFIEGLLEDSVGLAADALEHVDDDEGPVSDLQGGGDLAAELDVARTVDQVYQVARLLSVNQADARRLHRYHSRLLVRPTVHVSHLPH